MLQRLKRTDYAFLHPPSKVIAGTQTNGYNCSKCQKCCESPNLKLIHRSTVYWSANDGTRKGMQACGGIRMTRIIPRCTNPDLTLVRANLRSPIVVPKLDDIWRANTGPISSWCILHHSPGDSWQMTGFGTVIGPRNIFDPSSPWSFPSFSI